MTSKVAAVIDQIDTLLADCDTDSADLWALLTALRGPDRDTDMNKKETTAVLRGALFPKMVSAFYNDCKSWYFTAPFVPACIPDKLPVKAAVLSSCPPGSTHVITHFDTAVDAFYRKDTEDT